MAARDIRVELGIAGRSEQRKGKTVVGKKDAKDARAPRDKQDGRTNAGPELAQKIVRHKDELVLVEQKIELLSRVVRGGAGSRGKRSRLESAEQQLLRQKLERLEQRRNALVRFLEAHAAISRSDGQSRAKSGKRARKVPQARQANIRRARVLAGTPPGSGRRRVTQIG